MDNALELADTSREVMRGFLRAMGWRREDCRSLDVGDGPLARPEPRLAIAADLARREGAGRLAIETMLQVALRLDQRGAPTADLETALPEWLLNTHAHACLLLARALLRDGRATEAEALLRKALVLNDAFGAAQRELGLLLRAQDRLEDASAALESALATRRRIAFDGRIDSRDPVLVAQPNDAVEIFYYAGTFYVVPRDASLAGARAIAGELYAVRRNASYRVVRELVHLPLLRSLYRLRHGKGKGKGEDEARRARLPGFLRPLARAARHGVRSGLRRAALALFAEPIEHRAATLIEAIELAEQRLPRRGGTAA